MKNITYALIAICLLGASCKKDSAPKPNPDPQTSDKLYAVGFQVPEFDASSTQQLSTQATGASDLKSQIKYLYYYVYKEQDRIGYFGSEPFKEIVQNANDANFGKITDALPQGHYNIFFLGTQSAGTVRAEDKGPAGPNPIYDAVFYFSNHLAFDGEAYYAKIDTTISAPINKAVTLKRAVGKLTVKVKDAIPANAAKFVLSVDDFPPGFELFSAAGNSHSHSNGDAYPTMSFTFPVAKSAIGKQNFSFSALVWPFQYNTIFLDCYDAAGAVIAHKTILSYGEGNYFTTIKANTNYVFAGLLFSNAAGFNISINPLWNTPVNIPFSVSYTRKNTVKQ